MSEKSFSERMNDKIHTQYGNHKIYHEWTTWLRAFAEEADEAIKTSRAEIHELQDARGYWHSRCNALESSVIFDPTTIMDCLDGILVALDSPVSEDARDEQEEYIKRMVSDIRGCIITSKKMATLSPIIFDPTDHRVIFGNTYEASFFYDFRESKTGVLNYIDNESAFPFVMLVKIKPEGKREKSERYTFIREVKK